MGTNNLSTETDGTDAFAQAVNQLIQALNGDLVPRNSSGIPTDESGSAGTSSLKWLRAHIASGYFSVGDIKAHHSYNGAVGPGHGWMLCDGRIINETNYDAEFASGNWATYIVSSALNGLYLPNLTDKYLVGKATTPETGVGAIASEGNSSHQVNLAHSHTANSHNHRWFDYTNQSTIPKTYNSGGAAINLGLAASPTVQQIVTEVSGAGVTYKTHDVDSYTDNDSTGTNSSLSSTQSVKPESIATQIYMRII